MCGIFAVLGQLTPEQVEYFWALSKLMVHRGPDERAYVKLRAPGNEASDKLDGMLSHERLSIIDLHTGKQPIAGCSLQAYVVGNGENYNHHALMDELHAEGHTVSTTSDTECIVHLVERAIHNHRTNGTALVDELIEVCNALDGVFAFVCWVDGIVVAARDPIGVKPLYQGTSASGLTMFASEMKSLISECGETQLSAFPPGHFWTSDTGLVPYFKPTWYDYRLCEEPLDLDLVRQSLIDATTKRLMSDVPLGVLLSGGLDSSLTSAIASRAFDADEHRLLSFSIGLNADAPDLVAARKVAEFLGTEHHEVYFTVEQGIKAMADLVWHLETYDVTTIRASTPMYLLTEYVRRQGIKVLLSGEGADEILGGYLYFHNAPNDEEFQKETISRVRRLSTADCLRADKSTMAHSVEVRVPFLDKQFLQTCMSIAAKHKRPARGSRPEKWLLRQAFDDPVNPWLPASVLWRQKEQFSDGVGYNWIDTMKAWCESQVTDEQLLKASSLYPTNTPDTKEAFYIRQLFDRQFPGRIAAETVLRWTPKWQTSNDPSGRACSAHVNTLTGKIKEIVITEE